MPSLTRLSEAELLTQANAFIVQTLTDCGYTVCSVQRTHTEPKKMVCCDCDGPGGSAYTLYGWILRAFEADGALNEVTSLNCPTLSATQLGFALARCWPEDTAMPKEGGKRDATAAELAMVLDCLRSKFLSCSNRPAIFHVEPTEDDPDPPQQLCTRMVVGQFVPDNDVIVTPYGEDGKVATTCAGWKWTLTVA